MREVTFVVPIYNNPASTKRCLESFRRHFPDAPLVAVDDGSTDENRDALMSLAWPLNIPVLLRQNNGVSASFNAGAAGVTTGYLCLFHNDIEFHGAGWLGQHLDLLDSDPRIAAVSGWGNPDFRDDHGHTYTEAAEWGESGYCESPNGGLFTTRAETFKQIPFPTLKSGIGTDIEWCARCVRAGYVFYLCHGQVSHYMSTNDYAAGSIKEGCEELAHFYADVLRPRQPRDAVRFFMETGRWPEWNTRKRD